MMAKGDFVDGDGWISDDSSFYGDEELKSSLQRRVRRRLKQSYDPINYIVSRKARPDPISGPKVKGDENVLDFLKSRPQIELMEKTAAKDNNVSDKRTIRDTNEGAGADLLNRDQFNDDAAVWQQGETINEFLRRLPIADPATAKVGPWLWVHNPQTSGAQKRQEERRDVDAFVKAGDELLGAFAKRKLKTEAENPEKAPATITRKLAPYRDQLEEDLLSAAAKTGTTCGKWMLFPDSDSLPRYWRLVAEATSQGKLGPVSKVATHSADSTETLICVYTYDFTDFDDVRRVLDELADLGLCTKDGKPRYYKCDAYTHLNIFSDNPYKLRASLYSSKDVFGIKAKGLPDGPIARLKKRNQSIDDFFAP